MCVLCVMRMLHRRLGGHGGLAGGGSGRSGALIGLGESGERRQGEGGAEAEGGNLVEHAEVLQCGPFDPSFLHGTDAPLQMN